MVDVINTQFLKPIEVGGGTLVQNYLNKSKNFKMQRADMSSQFNFKLIRPTKVYDIQTFNQVMNLSRYVHFWHKQNIQNIQIHAFSQQITA